MHGLPMLQCVVPNSDAIVYHWQMHRVPLHFKWVVHVQGWQTPKADNTGLLREGLCNKLDGLETAVT